MKNIGSHSSSASASAAASLAGPHLQHTPSRTSQLLAAPATENVNDSYSLRLEATTKLGTTTQLHLVFFRFCFRAVLSKQGASSSRLLCMVSRAIILSNFTNELLHL